MPDPLNEGWTQGGRRSKERGRDGDATVTVRSRHKNVSITVLELFKDF